MYKKTINYEDYDGEKKTKTYYFNMTRPEMLEMDRTPFYNMQAIVDRVKDMDDPDKELDDKEKDEMTKKIGDILRSLVIQSYGEKSEDGSRFIKREGDRRYGKGENFVETMAFDALYMEMLDPGNLVNFVQAIIPAGMRADFDNIPEVQQVKAEMGDIVVLDKNGNEV